MVLDLPRYAALYDAYQITLANENAVQAIAAPAPVEMDEEEEGAVGARASVQEVVAARIHGVVGRNTSIAQLIIRFYFFPMEEFVSLVNKLVTHHKISSDLFPSQMTQSPTGTKLVTRNVFEV